MSSRSLPSAEGICSAATSDLCQSLVLRALAYGTDYDIVEPQNDTLGERSKDASRVLLEAWTKTDLEATLVNALWLVGSFVSEDNDASYQALVYVVKELVVNTPTDKNEFIQKLQATLDPPLLEVTGVLTTGKENMVKRLRKLNTDMYYRQQKYNLLQEESEGYAKLLFLLTCSSNSKNLAHDVNECMATFELDPNRVLDLTLDVLESGIGKKDCTPFLDLIKGFCIPKIPHLIGFKLSNYTKVPQTLYKTAALLTQHGLLDLQLLLPHLPPLSDIQDAHKTFESNERQYVQSLGRVRLSGGGNKDNKTDEALQKMQQARSTVSTNVRISLALEFLARGDWTHALELFGNSTIVCSFACTLLPRTVGNSVCAYIQSIIQPIYQHAIPPPALVSGAASLEKEEGEDETISTSLALTSSFDEVVHGVVEPLDAIVESGCIEHHPILYSQLCRLLGVLLDNSDNSNETNLMSTDPSYRLFSTFLVPSLSLFSPNPALSAELWSVLSRLTYSTRYMLYRDWLGGGLEKAGLMARTKAHCFVRSEMEAGKSARYSLKRLSKENVRDMGRQISKVTHSNPLVVFTTILNQIESYDNLIDMMVETMRFVTPLSLDVLGYCVLSRLMSGSSEDANRTTLKGDGVNVSQWLASLENFAGELYKKYPEVEFRGILGFIIRRLKDGSVVELGVLRTLLTTAGGYSFADYTTAASLSKVQLEGRSGSQLLKRETFAFGVVEKLNVKSSQRIRTVLQTDGMGVTILILLAQVRSRILFHQSGMTSKPIKLLGNLFDTCQVVMELLLEFLTDSTDEEKEGADKAIIVKYAEFMPTPGELHEKYGLDPASLSMLCRPLIRATMDDPNKKSVRNKLTKLDMALRKYRFTETVTKSFLPESAWSDMTPLLFDFFFTHSMYDIHCPKDCYTTEIARLTKEVDRLKQYQQGGAGAAAHKSVLAATAASAGATDSEIRRAMAFSKADEAELERVQHSATALSTDLDTQSKHCEAVRRKLDSKKDQLFPSSSGDTKQSDVARSKTVAFLTHCVYPRCGLSPDDALYCARFVFMLHELEVPGFGTLQYLDGLIDAIAGTLYCVSEGEAANMALLLWETWKVVSRWRYDEDAFAEEVSEKPGACIEKEIFSSEGENAGDIVAVTHDDYIVLYNKWHATIGQAAIGCLNSSEYMHNRACLIVLTRIVDVYPTRPFLGEKLIDSLAPLQDESNPLQDIRAMAQSYGFQVTKARDDGVWKEEDAAVTKARLEKEQAAVAERKKKAVEQLAEMKRDSDNITAEIGDSRTRGRGDDRRDDRRDRRRAPSRGAGGGSRGQSPMQSARAPVFEPPKGVTLPPSRLGNGDSTRDGGRRGREEPRGRASEGDRDRQPGDRRADRGAQGVQRGRGPSGLEGRWQRVENVSGMKRGRSPERDAGPPGDDRDNDRDSPPSSKRPRMDREGREGGDGRRRGGSPLHRGVQSQRGSQAPSSQPQHGDRSGGRSSRRGATSRR